MVEAASPRKKSLLRFLWTVMLIGGGIVAAIHVVRGNALMAVCNTIIAIGGLVMLLAGRQRQPVA